MNTCTDFPRLNLPAAAVLAWLACAMLSSCSVQKRTTAPGWHVELSSRQALTVQVHSAKSFDKPKLERSHSQRLELVVPRSLKTVQMPRIDRRLVTLRQAAFSSVIEAQEVHDEKDSRREVSMHGSATSTTTTEGILPLPDWQDEVFWLLESARKKRRLGVVCLTYGISWLVAAKHQKKAEQLCARVGSNLETVAPEALQRANEMRQKGLNRGIAWFLSGCVFLVVAGLLFVGLSTGFWIGIG